MGDIFRNDVLEEWKKSSVHKNISSPYQIWLKVYQRYQDDRMVNTHLLWEKITKEDLELIKAVLRRKKKK